MQKLDHKRLIAVLTIMLLILSSASCSRMLGQNNGKQQGQNQQQHEKKDPPSALTQMEKETDEMIQQIQKIRDQRAQMIRQQASTSQEQVAGNKSQQKGQNSSQGGQKGEQQEQKGNQNQAAQQAHLTVNWEDFEKKIKTLNELWNGYESEAKKDGAHDRLISQFEKQLNALTGTVMAHNEEETLTAANGLYQYYYQFFNLYRHNAPPEIKEMKYYIQEILINAEADKWEDAIPLLTNMDKAWQTAKSRMQKPNKELNARIDNAMQDFSQVVQQKDLHLVKIKGAILLKNVEKVK